MSDPASPICSTEEAIEIIRSGKMIILVDDEDRENEGDLTIAAEKITPEAINFMARYGRGLICLALSPSWVDERLKLPLMAQKNESSFGTNFTVSIEARRGVTTGISAFDRATTILTAIADDVQPDDIVTPGHIFPLRAKPGGVLVRTGQTEGSVDLSAIAGLKPAAVICEIMRDDGNMARMPDLIEFAKEHELKIATIADLIAYRMRFGQHTVTKVGEADLPTCFGDFRIVAFESGVDGRTHIALVKGEISPHEPVLVRVHSECLTGDVFGSLRCDCGGQLQNAMRSGQRGTQRGSSCTCARRAGASAWPTRSRPTTSRTRAWTRSRPTCAWASSRIFATTASAPRSWSPWA